MKRLVRITLAGTGILALLLALCAAVAVMVIDPNDFKPKIEAAAFAATGKHLVLQGDISLSLFPRLKVETGPATLEDTPEFGTEPFARLEKLSASVAVMPLFSGKAEIESVAIDGLRLNLVVNGEGKANWGMRPASGSGAAAPGPGTDPGKTAEPGTPSSNPAAIALDSLRIRDTLLEYTDMRSRGSVQVEIPSLEIADLTVGKRTALSLQAVYSASMARPIPLSMTAGFTLPSSLAAGSVFDAEGTLDGAPFSCKGTLALPETAEGRTFSLNGALTAGDLDIDKYLAAFGGFSAKPASAGTDTADGTAAKNDATLREFLRGMSLDLRVTAKSLTLAKIPVTNVAAALKAGGGLLTAKPVTMTVGEAPLNLEATTDATGQTLRTRLAGDWKGAKVGPLLKAATGRTPVTGSLSATWDLNAEGSAWPDAAKTLGGTAALSVTNGVVPGFRLIPAGVPGLPAYTLDVTDLAVSGTWKITGGIAWNNDLTARSTRLAAAGNGQVNIPARTLSYAISVELPTLAELPNLTVLPVTVSGPLASPSYGIDQPALLRETAKTILTPAVKAGGELQKSGEILGKLLSR